MLVVICPGIVNTPNPITIPNGAPEIDDVQAAEIQRLARGLANHAALAIQNSAPPDAHAAVAIQNSAPINVHLAAAIQGAAVLNDHGGVAIAAALADHTLNTQAAVGGLVTNVLGHDAVPQLETAAGANVVIAGCISVHAVGANPVAHAYAAGVDVVHAFGAGVATVHAFGAGVVTGHAGGDPVVAAVPAKLSQTTFSLSVNVLAGDLVRLFYMEQGARVHV